MKTDDIKLLNGSSRSRINNDQNQKWVLSNDSNLTRESLNGIDFAETMKSIAGGGFEEIPLKKVYSPTRKPFWEEAKYNPSLSYAHISHEFDAQWKEQENYWKKKGNKFTGEPRFPPYVKKAGDGVLESGLLFPLEIPKFNEREVEYFERHRRPLKFQRRPNRELKNKTINPVD